MKSHRSLTPLFCLGALLAICFSCVPIASGGIGLMGIETATRSDLRMGEKSNPATHKGDNQYGTVKYKDTTTKRTSKFFASIQNDGTGQGTFTATAKKNKKFKATFKSSGNITAAMTSGRHTTTLGSGQVQNIKVLVKPKTFTGGKQTYKSRLSLTGPNGTTDAGKVNIKFQPQP